MFQILEKHTDTKPGCRNSQCKSLREILTYGLRLARSCVNVRVDKYTAAGPNTRSVSTNNLPPPLRTPGFSAQAPPSPTASMRTYPSATMPTFGSPPYHQTSAAPSAPMPNPAAPNFPAQQARIPQPYSHADVSTLNNPVPPPSRDGKPSRSPSMIMTPGGSTSFPWADGISHMHIGSAEPRIFPGVVHERTRRNSLRQGAGSESLGEGNAGVALSKTATKDWDGHPIQDVVEEDEKEGDESSSTPV